jgi:hypothetical protein
MSWVMRDVLDNIELRSRNDLPLLGELSQVAATWCVLT